MGSKGGSKKAKPTAQERALAKDAAAKWNDYVERYVPVENEFVERTKASDDKVAAAQGMVNADANMAHAQAAEQARAGLASQGAAPGSGRAALSQTSLEDARGASSGEAQAIATQGVHDQEQNARVKMSAFGRDLQDNTSLSLGQSGRRATDAAVAKMKRKTDQRNAMISTGLSAAGAVVGGLNKGGSLDSQGLNMSGQGGVRAFSQQDRMLRAQNKGLSGFGRA